ncbi:hypothetical protein WH96_20260 [Kiloniella spongiae]|uniref:Uncharacterized protein n=1 Tax=Kiloniella spongiae TaxID=1489064 RepID=A0A0H2M8Z2_9PROT|nr:hypothetical protein [Kiloniella spongiae]KLN58959.1 hypothetical protein WH96_20260 [Kiloniella spongiae]
MLQISEFSGVPKQHFKLFLKECGERFNNSDPRIELAQIRQLFKVYFSWLSRTAPLLKKSF